MLLADVCMLTLMKLLVTMVRHQSMRVYPSGFSPKKVKSTSEALLPVSFCHVVVCHICCPCTLLQLNHILVQTRDHQISLKHWSRTIQSRRGQLCCPQDWWSWQACWKGEEGHKDWGSVQIVIGVKKKADFSVWYQNVSASSTCCFHPSHHSSMWYHSQDEWQWQEQSQWHVQWPWQIPCQHWSLYQGWPQRWLHTWLQAQWLGTKDLAHGLLVSKPDHWLSSYRVCYSISKSGPAILQSNRHYPSIGTQPQLHSQILR